jgi:hypothetical protein
MDYPCRSGTGPVGVWKTAEILLLQAGGNTCAAESATTVQKLSVNFEY